MGVLKKNTKLYIYFSTLAKIIMSFKNLKGATDPA